MYRFNSIHGWGISYIITTVVFSIIYLISFKVNPDSFILNKQLNLTPINDVYQYLWQDKKTNSEKFNIKSLVNLQIELTKTISELDIVENKFQHIQNEKKELELKIDIILKKKSDIMWNNVKKYKIKQKELPIYKLKNKLIDDLKILEKISKGKDSNAYYKIEIANKKLELAKTRVKISVNDYKTASYIVDNLNTFNDKEVLKEYYNLDGLRSKISKKQTTYSDKISKIRNRLHTYLEEWSKERSNALQWLDFIYYSIGIATTTTFGDITANNSSIRAIVSFQLLLSIFILGGFMNTTLNRNDNKT